MISEPKNLPATDAVTTSVEDSCRESLPPLQRLQACIGLYTGSIALDSYIIRFRQVQGWGAASTIRGMSDWSQEFQPTR